MVEWEAATVGDGPGLVCANPDRALQDRVKAGPGSFILAGEAARRSGTAGRREREMD